MSKRKSVIIMLIVFLAIGFATVSTTLVLNGILAIGENIDDFNIIFTKAKLNGVNRNDFISEDKKHINFISNELKTLEDKAILNYEVTNTSRNYDADVQVTCTAGTTDLITFEYTPHEMEVLAGETKTGTFTASMFKLVDEATEVPIECSLTATAKTREELGDVYIAPFSKSGVMMRATNSYLNPTGMWSYRSNITRVIFEDELIPHETADNLIFDISDKQDNSVMAYLVPNEETLTMNKDYNNKDLTDTTAYTLYLQGDTGVIANNNSDSLFAYFNNLKVIDNIKYFDVSNVTDMTYMFHNCMNLASLDLSSFDTSRVANMYWMFSECNNITSLSLSSFNTSNVKNMARMFYNCEKITQLDVSNFDTSQVKDMSYMFYNCQKLTSLNISRFNTSSVTNMCGMFFFCQNLLILDVSTFDTSNVTNMAYMFGDCNKLKELDVSNFNTSQTQNMKSIFSDCYSLTGLDVSNFDTSKVTDMGSMFVMCHEVTVLDVSKFNVSNVTNMRGMFSSCSSLKELDVSNFNTSNAIDMEEMFYGCENLTTLDVSNFDTSQVTDMSHMFRECKKITNISVSTFDTSNVTDMRGMFAICSSLKKLDLSNFEVTNVAFMNAEFKNGSYSDTSMFYDCSALEELYLDNFDTKKLTSLSRIFASCTNLKKLSIKNLSISNVTQMREMFDYCSSLIEIDISNWNIETLVGKEVDTTMAFSGLTSPNIKIYVKDKTAQDWILALSSTDRPDSWTTENVIIKEAA